MEQKCPVCCSSSDNHQSVKGPIGRRYYHCSVCDLVFVSPEEWLTLKAEKMRYQKHENDSEDPGYLNFLNLAVKPALAFLQPGSRGLDYGSGPCPAISKLLKENGFECHNYDPLFGPSLPSGPFDFIFSTEVFEHFHHPRRELDQLDSLLKPEGIFTVMTMFRPSAGKFEEWFYARDDTHVLFFSMNTFEFIAKLKSYDILWNDGKRVVIFRKKT